MIRPSAPASPDPRRCILNAIVWTAKLDVPADGFHNTLPDLASFKPESLEHVPPKPKPAATK